MRRLCGPLPVRVMPDDRDQLETFHQRIHLAVSVTAAYPRRLVVLHCRCRDSVLLAYVARGAVRHVSFMTWN